MRSSGRRARLIYVGYICAIIVALTMLAEFVLLPAIMGLPRDMLLMGFVGTPHEMVNDTYINGMGFAGDELHVQKPRRTIRVLTLGGSAFFNRRMAERLKAALQEALIDEILEHSTSAKRVEVLGGALRTHTTMSSILKYGLLAKYDFDYVLIYHGINDLWVNGWNEYGNPGPWYKRNVILDHSIIARLIYNESSRRLALMERDTEDAAGGAGEQVPAELSSADGFPSTEFFRENMTRLVTMVRASGAEPVLMTFAWLILPENSGGDRGGETLEYNNPQNYDRMPVELWGQPEDVRKGLTRHNQIVREMAAELDVPLIDQEALMGKELLYYGDVCHLSELGTRRFVQHIADFFREKGLFDTVRWERMKRTSGGLASFDWLGGVRCTEENQPIRIDVSSERPVIMNGWAVDRNARNVARGVYVTLDDEVVSYAEYGSSRPDVADQFQNEDYERSGWRAYILPAPLPCGLHKVSLRIVSHDGKSFYVPESTIAVQVTGCH